MPKSIIGTVIRVAEDTLDRSIEILSADGATHKIPAHHARELFRVGQVVEYYTATGGGIPLWAEVRLVRTPFTPPPPPVTDSFAVTVLEQPTLANDDYFVVVDDRGERWRVPFWSTEGYLKAQDGAVLVVERQGKNVYCKSLRSASDTPRRFPRRPGRVKVESRHTHVWTGYRWMTLSEALDAGLVEPHEVGHSLQTIRVGGGAYDSPGEYSIEVFLWRVAEGWLLDLREEAEGCELYEYEAEAVERVEEIRESYDDCSE
jgi:hypothetical protein